MSEARKAGSGTDSVIPDKLYFRIGEVARLLAVEPHTLRFWESEFPQLRVNKGGTGQRLYRRKDVETALEIKRLLYDEGYTIPGARQLLQSRARRKALPELPFPKAANHPPAAKGVPANAEAPLLKMRTELEAIRALLSRPVKSATSPDQGAKSFTRALPGSRRGLHLASRQGREASRVQNLFGPTIDT